MSDSAWKVVDELHNLTESNNQFLITVEAESLLWGCYIVIFVIAIHLQRGQLQSTNKLIMFAATILLFLSSTVLFALDLASFHMNQQILLSNVPADSTMDSLLARLVSLQEKVLLKQETLSIHKQWLFLFNMLMTDAVVTWRTIAIWNRKKIIIFLTGFFFLVCAAFSLTDVACIAAGQNTEEPLTATRRPVPEFCPWVEYVAWNISLFTNILSTVLIAIKAWSLRRFIKRTIGTFSQKTQVQCIMSLLVESGIVYCFLWGVASLQFNFWGTSHDSAIAKGLFAAIRNQLTGIYPTAIIVAVKLNHTFVEIGMGYSSRSSDTKVSPRTLSIGSRMHFASGGGGDRTTTQITSPTDIDLELSSESQSDKGHSVTWNAL